MQLRFYDTNILMESDDSFFKNEFAVAAQTVIEHEEIKTASYKDEETKYKARWQLAAFFFLTVRLF